MSDAEKTEKATPDKRRKAREQGQFARGRDLGGVAASLAVLFTLGSMGPAAIDQFRAFTVQCFHDPFDLVHGYPTALVQRTVSVLGNLVMPGAIAAAVAGVAAGFAQAGFHPQLDLLMPNFGRMNPIAGLKSKFSPGTALTELAQSTVRVAAVAYVAYWTLSECLPPLLRLSRADLLGATSEIGRAAYRLTIRSSFALALLALGDWGFSKLRLEKQMMMSRQEIKDEVKSQEGDPRVKNKARARARERLKRGLAKQIKSADVVLANPTHVSVALRYRAKEGAPVVLAKGYDEVALHIRALAREAKIPVIENRPLARAIADRVRVGKPIPVDLYAAVAEILAFVYRLKGRTVFG